MNKASRISAVTVTLYARKTTLDVSKVKYLPEYSCNKTFGPEQDAFFPYSISFICRSSLVRRSAYKLSNFVIIFFTGDVSCENNCDYKLKKDDDVDLYEIDVASEDCNKPDFPPYGHSRSWPRNRTAFARSQDLAKIHNHAMNRTSTNPNQPANLTVSQTATSTTPPISTPKMTAHATPSTISPKVASSIAPSTTTTETSASSSKLPPHFYDTINSDITSSDSASNETATENPNFTSPNEPTDQTTNTTKVETTKVETNKQKYYCNQHFVSSIADSEDFDEVMRLSRYSIKQFEKCDKGEDWQYHQKLPVCLPETYCTIPPIPDNVIPSFSSLYQNQYAVVHDEITFKCLNSEDVNIGGSLMACLTTGNWSGLPPRCVTKNLHLSGNNGIVYLSISVSLVSLIILLLAIYCAIKLNHTANKAVRVFNEQHQQLVQQQNLSAQSSLNSSLVPDSVYSAGYGQVVNEGRELPKVPSLYREHIYDSVQNVVNEPRYVAKTLDKSLIIRLSRQCRP